MQQIITQSLQSACLSASAARQTRRIREIYFASLARQPMSFADTNDCGALASGVLEATTVMAAGTGGRGQRERPTYLAEIEQETCAQQWAATKAPGGERAGAVAPRKAATKGPAEALTNARLCREETKENRAFPRVSLFSGAASINK